MNYWRWLLFIPSKLLDLLTIIFTALYTVYFWKKVRGQNAQPLTLHPHTTLETLVEKAKQDVLDEYGFARPESHTLLTQAGVGYFNPELREKLLESVMKPSGTLYRRYPNEEEHLGPSGDGLSSWVFCYNLWDVKRPDLVKRLTDHYLKNCFGLWWDRDAGISARSSNGGVNLIVDGWPKGESWYKGKYGISQPITGPAYFTSAALLSLAAKELGGLYKLAYYLHYALCGGWFYRYAPLAYFKKDLIFYTHQITSLNLWSLCKNGRNYKFGLKYLCELVSPAQNAQPFLCMLGWNAKAISSQTRSKAIFTLLTIKGAHFWPQHAPTDDNFYFQEVDQSNFSMMGLAADLLRKD